MRIIGLFCYYYLQRIKREVSGCPMGGGLLSARATLELKKELRSPTLLAVHCETPMISTVMFSGAEFYCPKCGETQGIFCTENTDSTPDLLQEREANQMLFLEISGDLIPTGAQFGNCVKCKSSSEDHRLHASHRDLEKSDAAYKKLYRGILS